MPNYPRTPDGRYFLVRGRLWRLSDPRLSEEERERLVADLMRARRAVREAKGGDPGAMRAARTQVDEAKRGLGERGPVWWDDGAPDYNRRMARGTPYAAWSREQDEADEKPAGDRSAPPHVGPPPSLNERNKKSVGKTVLPPCNIKLCHP